MRACVRACLCGMLLAELPGALCAHVHVRMHQTMRMCVRPQVCAWQTAASLQPTW